MNLENHQLIEFLNDLYFTRIKSDYEVTRDLVENRLIKYNKDKIILEMDRFRIMCIQNFDKDGHENELKNIKKQIDNFLEDYSMNIKHNNLTNYNNAYNTLLEKYEQCCKDHSDLIRGHEIKGEFKCDFNSFAERDFCIIIIF
jgi:hypothetical protein